MNITLALQELDDLIIRHTQPPVTPMLRNKLHPLREQLEAYIAEKEKLATDHAELVKKHQTLQVTQSKKTPEIQVAGKRIIGKFRNHPI